MRRDDYLAKAQRHIPAPNMLITMTITKHIVTHTAGFTSSGCMSRVISTFTLCSISNRSERSPFYDR